VGAGAADLIVLIVHDEVLLPLLVEDSTLVSVLNTLVTGDGEDGGVGLVGDIVDGEGVLVVAVADVAADVLGVGTAVDEALGVVDVAVLLGAADAGGLGGVLQVEEDEATKAVDITGTRADRGTPLGLLVDDDVVGGADGELVEETGEVAAGELDGLVALLEVDGEELLEVEDLDTVTLELGADDDVVLVATDLLPQGAGSRGDDGGQEAEDLDAALGQNLDERGAVVLAVGDELTARLGVDPTPGARASAELGVGAGGAELGVVDEVVEVDVLALEGVKRVALDGLGNAVDTPRVSVSLRCCFLRGTGRLTWCSSGEATWWSRGGRRRPHPARTRAWWT
jgi:hypothetical protein